VEETGVRGIGLEQSQAFGDPGRDPRGWTVSVTFQVLLNAAKVKPRAADDAAAVDWFPISKLPALAFDHAKIIAAGLEQLRSQRLRTPLGLHLLPKRFVLFDLKRIHEAVLGQRLDMINFRRELTGRGIVRCVRVGARSWYEFTRPMRAD
jgi:8-oxo-dGTP diphosphatase